ncbi:MAG: phage capsid protein [Kiritimatiellia bacterium]
MADTAFQIQYRQEVVMAFEQHKSVLRESVITESVIKGNQATFLVAGSGGATAVTRGIDGKIPGRADDLNQPVATLYEWHDKVQRTGFNIFASQGDGRRIMQETTVAVINRRADEDIITQLETATINTGTAQLATLGLVTKTIATLGINKVQFDGNIFAAVTPAFISALHSVTEFSNADYVTRKPVDSGDSFYKDMPGYYNWLGVKWIVHPDLPGNGTSAEKCFMYHRNAIGHAMDTSGMQTYADYNEEDDYSWARCGVYMGGKLLQNAGVVVMNHKGDEFNFN